VWNYKEWQEESKQGIKCGMLGCYQKPVVQCTHCGFWYCGRHKDMHFHIHRQEEVQRSEGER